MKKATINEKGILLSATANKYIAIIDRSKIELWHHDIDGKGDLFMDWECTPGYCEAIGKEFGIPVFFSWKMGGFKREMLRENALTAPIQFENEAKEVITVGGKTGKPNTRKRFPQVSPDLSVRWCSSYCKIDVDFTGSRK